MFELILLHFSSSHCVILMLILSSGGFYSIVLNCLSIHLLFLIVASRSLASFCRCLFLHLLMLFYLYYVVAKGFHEAQISVILNSQFSSVKTYFTLFFNVNFFIFLKISIIFPPLFDLFWLSFKA